MSFQAGWPGMLARTTWQLAAGRREATKPAEADVDRGMLGTEASRADGE